MGIPSILTADTSADGPGCPLKFAFKVTLQEIVDYVKKLFNKISNKNKIRIYYQKVNEKNFHIHHITIGQILLNNNDGTIWICGHR